MKTFIILLSIVICAALVAVFSRPELFKEDDKIGLLGPGTSAAVRKHLAQNGPGRSASGAYVTSASLNYVIKSEKMRNH